LKVKVKMTVASSYDDDSDFLVVIPIFFLFTLSLSLSVSLSLCLSIRNISLLPLTHHIIVVVIAIISRAISKKRSPRTALQQNRHSFSLLFHLREKKYYPPMQDI